MKFYPVTSLITFILISICSATAQSGDKALSGLIAEAEKSLVSGISFFHSINIEGGYVYHYTLDLKEKWGEGKTDNFTIEVQPPGTPAVGMSFLRAYSVLKNPEFLQAAQDAADALIKGRNKFGGWDHKIHFNKSAEPRVSFDDNQTQSAISFLMALDRIIDQESLTEAIEKSLEMMIKTQLENGAWPHQYPPQGNYHDYATFNDQGINDCIRVMLEAQAQYDHLDYRKSLDKVGRFLLISQLPPPQPGWAQQYNEYLQPAWARSFEPPSVCPQVTVHNIGSLMDIYQQTGQQQYLEAIPDAIRWLKESRLPNGKWGRFLELGTNRPLYYDRDRIRVNSLEELSLERRTGYGYEIDIQARLDAAEIRFNHLKQEKGSSAATRQSKKSHGKSVSTELIKDLREVIDSQDGQGRWIIKQDKFRKDMDAGQNWNGEYRFEDRISSALFNQNVEILCSFLELTKGL